MKQERTLASIASDAIEPQPVEAYEWGIVSIPDPAGARTSLDLFVRTSETRSRPAQTSRLRLELGMLNSLAHGLAEATELLSRQGGANVIQRTLDRVDIAQVLVHTQSGDQPAFLLTLEQTETGGRKTLPSRLVVTPEQLLGLYDLLRETIARHQLAQPLAPAPETRQ